MKVSRKLIEKLIEQEKAKTDDVDLQPYLDEMFPEQRDFALDPSPRKAGRCNRRAGKSNAVAIMLLMSCMSMPCDNIYFGRTRDKSWNVIYHQVLKPLLARLCLYPEINLSERTLTFANGSRIFITGADATLKEMDKFRGLKYRFACIDECQSWTNNLNVMVTEVLGPALLDMNDRGSQLVLIGTPGNRMGESLWYQITHDEPRPRLPGWSVHTWSALQNPHVRAQFLNEIEKMKSDNPLVTETKSFRQEYMNEWVIDDNVLVYSGFSKERNIIQDEKLIEELNNNPFKKWKYFMGIDFGVVDSCAWVVIATNSNDKNMYIVESFKRSRMIVTDVAEFTANMANKYSVKHIVGDGGGLGKAYVELIQQRFHLPITSADKQQKYANIESMNSDFTTANIKVIESQNGELIKEWQNLIWNENKLREGKREVANGGEDHVCDASLYVYRLSKHFRAKEIFLEEKPFNDIMEEKMLEHSMKMREMNKTKTFGKNTKGVNRWK